MAFMPTLFRARTIRRIRATASLRWHGITTRLAVALLGVAVLMMAAELFTQHGSTSATMAAARNTAAARGEITGLDDAVARASVALSTAISAFDRAAEARARVRSARTRAEFIDTRATLDQRMRAYLGTTRAFAPRPRLEALAAAARRHVRGAFAFVRDADRQRALSFEYATTLAALSARVQASMEGSWNLFGRVLVRRSLVDLDRALQSMWLASDRLATTSTYGKATLSSLNTSSARFASLLQAHAQELSRMEGPQWLSEVRADLEQVRALGAKLEAMDRREAVGLSSLDGTGLALIGAIQALESQAPRPRALPQPQETQGSRAMPAPPRSTGGRLLLWLSVAVLFTIFLLAIATTFGIVRRARRLIAAMGRLAAGDSSARIARGGIRELDALACAFNRMAKQIDANQRQLESTVAERTLQFRHLEEHDPLTQLPNRRQLLSHLRRAVERAHQEEKRLAVLIVDLDNFKTLNESVDHGFGDRVLIAISQRVCEVAGPTSFVARLGGDEFTVVHELARDAPAVSEVGPRLLQAFSSPLRVDDRELSMGISVGASVYPDHADSAEGLLRAADAAVFQAKAAGRSQMIHFSPVLLEDASGRFRVEQGLRRAIDRGELELHFQPEVSLANPSTRVLEALVRWRLEDGTLVAPGEFLPIAEQSGLILEIGDWVTRRAIETASAWYHSGLTQVRVAVNVSARQLLAPGFVDRVTALLESKHLPRTCFELELTENALQTEPATIDVLRALREADIALALDDFGAGYSSLASLEQLPLSRVKLDRTLIADIHTSARSLAIARSIMGLCRKLGLEVTAEGVEDLYQLAVLLPEGSMLVQGFLIGRPAPEEDTLSLMRTMRDRMTALVRQATLLSRDSAWVRRGDALRARSPRRVRAAENI
jgi:diguanylate cyclase (GGDEF)-like protein